MLQNFKSIYYVKISRAYCFAFSPLIQFKYTSFPEPELKRTDSVSEPYPYYTMSMSRKGCVECNMVKYGSEKSSGKEVYTYV